MENRKRIKETIFLKDESETLKRKNVNDDVS
jgi:hypothetical protein